MEIKIDAISKFLNTETAIDKFTNKLVNSNNDDEELIIDDEDDNDNNYQVTVIEEDDEDYQDGFGEIVTYDNDKEVATIDDETEKDFKNARTNIRDVIDKGMDALNDMLAIAKESENAKNYESVANYMKTMVELNEKLLNINNKAPKETGTQNTQNITNTNNTNTIICTSPADLLNALKNKEKE